jgi:ATP-binding cassette subfamily F protein 3
LFHEDDVFKTIGVLSGGERNRYALARMLLHPANFLLLDEPTNHLDLRAKDVLLEALQKFSGTVVFVSHDRYFIDKLATRIFEVGGGEVRVYPGNYEDYRWRKERAAAGAEEESRGDRRPRLPGSAEAPQPTLADVPGNGKEAAAKKRINPIKLRQMEQRRQEIEEEVTRLETVIADCENALTRFVSADETARQTAELAKNRAELQKLMAEWESVSQVLEESS